MKNKLKNLIVQTTVFCTIAQLLLISVTGCTQNKAAPLKPGSSKYSTLIVLGFDQSLSVADFRQLDTGFVASVCSSVAKTGGLVAAYGIGNATDKSGLRCYLERLPEIDKGAPLSEQAKQMQEIKRIASVNAKRIREFLQNVQKQIFVSAQNPTVHIKNSDVIGFFNKADVLLDEPVSRQMTRYVFAYTDGIQSLPGGKDYAACYKFNTAGRFTLCLAGWKAKPSCNFLNPITFEDPQGFLHYIKSY